MRMIEENRIERKKSEEQDVTLLKPDMLALLESFSRDGAPTTKANPRSLAMLKMHSKKRNRAQFEAERGVTGSLVVSGGKRFKNNQGIVSS